MNVVKLSVRGHILTSMREFTQVRDRMNVRDVGKPSARWLISLSITVHILEKSPMSAANVERPLAIPQL